MITDPPTAEGPFANAGSAGPARGDSYAPSRAGHHHIPAPPSHDRSSVAGGAGGPARDVSGGASRAAGHIPCAICTHTIDLDDYRSARCWTDPQGITVAAHAACLIRVGEQEIGLR